MWFFYALVTTFAWGAADLFYKKGAQPDEKFSHLKTSITVGVIMGAHALFILIYKGIDYNPMNLLIYLPVSLMYILSMTVGYFGLRYLELSLSSPVQNSSGAITSILCWLILKQTLGKPATGAVVLICAGVILLGVFESREARTIPSGENKKYIKGITAFMMPVLYSVIDAMGTFFDAYYLDSFETTPLLDVTEENFEDVANISYEFTFLIAAVILFVYVALIKKDKFKFGGQKNRTFAAVFETAGQATYVYAMSGNGIAAAPMIASYSIVSLVLSRLFLKEKLTKAQYAAIVMVIAGIAILGAFEG